jgi:PAS domain S-box-containing protein
MQASATVLWNAPLIQGTIINFRDITIEKERENKITESEKTFRNIFNGVSDAIFLLNKDRKFITVNEGAVKMFQYDKELFINNTPEFLSAPNKNDFPKVNQCISDTFDGKSSSIIFWGKRKNNEIFPKIVTFNPSSYFGEQVCLVSAIDITERMKYENLLKANEQKLRAYLENTLAGIISINSNGNIQFCNNAFIQMLEFGGNTEIAGIKFQNLLHPDDKSKYSSTSTSFNDIRLLTKSGKYIWVRMTQSKIDIPNEEIQYVLVFINVDNEIKYRNELSQNFNMLQAVMNNVPVPIFYKDLDSTILDCNISIQEYFNAPKEAIVGKKVEELLAVDPIHKEKDEEVKKKSYVSYTFQFKDREFIIHKSALRNKTDEIIAIIVSMIDITDIKQKNEELKLLSDTQSKILSLIAHDFRSIIATQKSLTDFILSDNMSYDEIIELQKSMKPSIDSTFNMIDNILIWAQSQQGRIQFSPERILLYPIIEESIKSLQMYAHIKGITILQNIPHDIMGYFDKNQLNAIIQNLLTNALKFTNPQGRVEIHAKEENNEIQIKITDTGIGMTNETIDSILNKHFIFSERGTENEKGSGLGMQIISDFIKAHQGQLLIESKPDKGSTIRVIFPVSRNEHS